MSGGRFQYMMTLMSKFEEINAKNDLEYNLNYQPLKKWTKDHP